MKFNLKDYIEIAIIVPLIIVLGYFFYSVGKFLAFPGSKILTQATFISFMFSCVLCRVRKMGSLSLACLVFGGLMSLISVIMGIVIVVSAFIVEFISWIIFGKYHDYSIMIAAAMYSTIAFVLTVVVSVFTTGIQFNTIIANSPTIIYYSTVVAFGLGLLGSYLGVRLMNKRFPRQLAENDG